MAQTNSGLYGTFTLQTDGSYSYTLNNALPVVQSLTAGQQVTETFTYTVTDQHGASASNIITITVRGTNGSPQVSAATASINEDDASVSGILPAPTDLDPGDTAEYVPQTNISGLYGTFSLQTDGSYTYTLNNALSAIQQLGVGHQLSETFSFTVVDQNGLTASNILTITINGTNDAPQVSAASTSIYEDAVSVSGVLPAASDVDAGDITQYVAQASTPGFYGSFTLQANGSYTYTLNNALAAVQQLGVGAQLTETFTYTATDQHGATSSSTITITINGTNDAPQVSAAVASINEDQASVSGTLPIPTDIDVGDTPAYVPQTAALGLYGSFTLQANGNYTYALNNALAAVQQLGVGAQLTETFTYTVSDGHGGTATNTLTVTIHGTNDAPQVTAAVAAINEDQTSVSGTLPVPTDVDIGDTPAYVPQTNAAGLYGTFTLQANGNYTYALNNALAAVQQLGVGAQLTETFTYTVSDGHGGTATNTLTITINGTNDAPQVIAAVASINEDQISIGGTLPVPTDIDIGDTPSYVPQTGALGLYGSFTLQADGSYTYALNNALTAVQQLGVGAQLTETFTYTVSDGHGGTATNTLTIAIHGTNDAPQVTAAVASINEDQISIGGTLPVPTDIDIGDIPTYVPQTGAAGLYGSFTLLANGSYTYALNNALTAVQQLGVGAQLTETFTYTVSDGHGGTATNTLTLTIHGTNDAPQVAAAVASINEDQASVSGTLPVPTDIDIGDTPAYVPQTNAAGLYGSFTLQANGNYTYALNNALAAVQQLGVGAQLTETFTYTVSDGRGGTATNTLTITVRGTNDAPQVTAAVASINEDQVSIGGTLPVPTDIDIGDIVTYVPQTSAAGLYGSFTLLANGSYTYALNNALTAVQQLGVGAQLTETLTYTVSDGHGGTATNTLTITIRGTNDAPQVSAAVASINEDQASISGNLPVPTDIDLGDVPVYLPQSSTPGLYGSFTLQANGSYTYALNNDLTAVQQLGVVAQLT